MTRQPLRVVKPRALHKGAKIVLVSPASPPESSAVLAGVAELQRLGFKVEAPLALESIGYFAASHENRLKEFADAFVNKDVDGVFATRGGYGSNYLLDFNLHTRLGKEKALVGFSDLSTIQILLWQVRNWITFYGPMAAVGFNRGANQPHGYDEVSFLHAVRDTSHGWEITLSGEILVKGEAEGRLLGGCLTLLQSSIGTGFELDTSGSILVLEDRGVKPYQLDRALMHLKHAGKLKHVHGIILGDFSECEPVAPGSPTVRDVCERILAPLGVPIIFGAPIGHSTRPMLTIPLGVRAHLHADGEGKLEILEPAVVQ
jgi:muramoyltetrapeptide carboxypeptidase